MNWTSRRGYAVVCDDPQTLFRAPAALISRENYDNIRADQVKAVQANEEAVRLAQVRYMEGCPATSKFSMLCSGSNPARFALAQTEVKRRLVVVQLYKALGGEWNLTDVHFMSAQLAMPRLD